MVKKSSKDAKSLQESLAESLKQAVPGTAEARGGEAANEPIPEKPAAVSSAAASYENEFLESELKRTTVTMKVAEQSRAGQILDVLQNCRRHRGGLTEAISIALRLCPLDDIQIGRAWDESRATDRRTHKKIKR